MSPRPLARARRSVGPAALRRRVLAAYRTPTTGRSQKVRTRLLLAATWPKVARARASGRRLLLVHQPGKVGSRAIYDAITASARGRDHEVFHTHSLAPALRAQRRAERAATAWAPRHSWAEAEHVSRLVRNRPGRPLVITVIRDPFDAHPSAFLQNPDWFVPGFAPYRDDLSAVPFDQLREAYRTRFPHLERLEWYDREIRDVFGVDVLRDEPVEEGSGYWLHRSATADVAVIHYERLAEGFAAFSAAHLGGEIPLAPTNVTQEKGYGDIVLRLREDRVLPAEIREAITASPLYQRFYAPTSAG